MFERENETEKQRNRENETEKQRNRERETEKQRKGKGKNKKKGSQIDWEKEMKKSMKGLKERQRTLIVGKM